MSVLPAILQAVITNERISRLIVTNDTMQVAAGTQMGGPNVERIPVRSSSYDIFDDTRRVPTAVLPTAHSATIARQPVGRVNYTIPRTAERLSILMENINQLRMLGGSSGVLDDGGMSYIAEQERIVRQAFANLREFQTSAMFRGSYTYTVDGDHFTHGYTGGSITIDYQIPTGNKTQLDMLGAGSIIGTAWDNAAAPIISDIFQVHAAFVELTGMGLTDIWVSSIVWGFVLANTQVSNQAGSVNQVFEFIERDPTRQDFTARLKAVPWVTWHITDNGLDVDGTFTKLIPDTAAVFTVPLTRDVVTYGEGMEPFVDPVSNQESNQFGEFFYHKLIDDPVAYEFHGRLNGLPMLKIPKGIAFGTVDF